MEKSRYVSNLRGYYIALKPERAYANVMTTAAGFLFASRWHVDRGLLVGLLVGTTLVVMSACAANNATDAKLDARMPRTQKRATASGVISARYLAVVAAILGLLGFTVLLRWTNYPTVWLGIVGYVDYVVLYAWSKRTTPWSTFIGTVSGAVPVMAGYTAYLGQFDFGAVTLGLVMVFWQMVHFYAIGIFRLSDYRAGGLPIWPVRYGVRSTQVWMLVYVVLYLLALWLLSWTFMPNQFDAQGFTAIGTVFTVVVGACGLYWLWLGLKGFRAQKPEKWARGMFGFSLVVLLIFSAGIAFSPLLPS